VVEVSQLDRRKSWVLEEVAVGRLWFVMLVLLLLGEVLWGLWGIGGLLRLLLLIRRRPLCLRVYTVTDLGYLIYDKCPE